MRSVAVNAQKAVVIWSWTDQVFSVESESADPLSLSPLLLFIPRGVRVLCMAESAGQ